ncbi:hypothetical protein [Paenibacillus sp. SI8]|uniref:hypothetical protein n=1 Tax=unclassified Paenibacillus TaxID=185978 RepID=UPI0034657F1A
MGGGPLSVFTRTGSAAVADDPQDIANRIASDFESFLDAWHSADEVYDNELDAQIHDWYTKALRGKPVFPPRDIPYFSPSSANSDPRELYEKIRGAKRDKVGRPPHQGRWTRIGTAIGDVIQRDILYAEKHGGEGRRFSFERNPDGTPVFEDFAKKAARFKVRGKEFALFGTCDGIMRYVSEDGEIIRIGLEVKSKQTTYAQTSDYSTRNGPKEDHVKQTVCYSLMYGTAAEPIDYYIILYVNASKKSWIMTTEEYAKSRDIKAFGVAITEEMRVSVLESLADVLVAVDNGEPPALDLDKWTFNNYKQASALSLSDAEMAALERQVAGLQASQLPDWKKRGYAESLADIKRIRTEAAA